jgi:hypothetical protein
MITIMVAVGMEIIKDRIIIRTILVIIILKVRASLGNEEIVLITTIGTNGIGTIIIIRVIFKKKNSLIIAGEDLGVIITSAIITSTETERNHMKEIIINTKINFRVRVKVKVKVRVKIGEITKIKTIIDSIKIIIIKINHNKEEVISIIMIK